jgi:uncharacterized protein YjbI with pentapeptide repeats
MTMVRFTHVQNLFIYGRIWWVMSSLKITAIFLSMLTVIYHAFHTTKSRLSINKKNLLNILLRIVAVPAKIGDQWQQHKSPKQRLKSARQWLASQTTETSLAVIYDLELMAQDYPEYHWVIMNTLTNFVRNHAPYLSQRQVLIQPTEAMRTDIQAAITVISRRDFTKDPENQQIDLSYTNMQGINLTGVNLAQTNLYQTNLSQANLMGANLQGAILSAADLSDANLNQANLQGAILCASNLNRANLSGANLHRANLYLAKLSGANLDNAILNEANLREAKFSL